ncbi:acyltransferase family protein [Agrococcus beijingensis]|uniref:acyltransferase family protein n=1 Tax=Agrococcus beijingensis TaxID=3068634 RepID=UPI00274096EA|nr:acyltransferase family protein [Agrococcus sp. REN33]
MTTTPRPRRNDLQGLRALASLLVATSHVWFGNVSGGVDVFFAIGGYLLASSLVGEIERSGRVGVLGALWRQAKRLFPMAGIVLVVVGSITLAASGPLLFDRIAHDLFAAATYRENERLASTATDYLASGVEKSEVQHFWAMSVQGQYTAVCIIALGLLALVLGTRAAQRARRVAGIGLGVVALASFVYACVQITVDPVPAYYDTYARAWELALGGFAALVLTRIALSSRARTIMGVVGIALVVTAGLLPQDWAQPGPVTLWPVAGALLVLLAGDGGDGGPVARALQWRPLVWLGGISYGLYLWHWPVLKGLVALDPAQADGVSPLAGVLVIGVSIALSWVCTRLIARVSAPRPRPAWSLRPRRAALVPLLPAVALAASVAIAISPAVQATAIDRNATAVPAPATPGAVERMVSASVSFPSASAASTAVGEAGQSSEWLVDNCSSVDQEEVEGCFYEDPAGGEQEVWIVGDSQAVTLAAPTRRALAGVADVQLLGREMCPFSNAGVVGRELGDEAADCAAHNDAVLALAEKRTPDLVVVTYGAWWTTDGYRRLGPDVGQQLATGTRALVDELGAMGVPSVWLDSAPPFPTIDECLHAQAVDGDLSSCTAPLDARALERHTQMVATLSAGGVDVVDTLPWYCDVERVACPLFTNGVPTWTDAHHVGAAGAMQRLPLIADALLPRLGVDPSLLFAVEPETEPER